VADITPLLVARLADGATGALVGDRIGPVPGTQAGPLPEVTYQRNGGSPLAGMTVNTGIDLPVYDVSVWARTLTDAQAVAEAVKADLERWEDPTSDPEILDCFLQNVYHDFDQETELHEVTQTFEIWSRE
jgi:hypothetical protein